MPVSYLSLALLLCISCKTSPAEEADFDSITLVQLYENRKKIGEQVSDWDVMCFTTTTSGNTLDTPKDNGQVIWK